jgi:hypothetical protein
MSWCEANRVDYVFGLARNERLVGAIADSLALAAPRHSRLLSLPQGRPSGGSHDSRDWMLPDDERQSDFKPTALGLSLVLDLSHFQYRYQTTVVRCVREREGAALKCSLGGRGLSFHGCPVIMLASDQR